MIVGERLNCGDGERKMLLTRQMSFESLLASVLFALVVAVCVFISLMRWMAS